MTPDGDLNPALGHDGHAETMTSATNQEQPPQAQTKSQASRAIREIVETLLLAALIFFLVRLVVLNFRVDGESMLPNLDDGEMLLVNRNAYLYFDVGGTRYYPFDPPERGDVIVFDPPTKSDKPYIKRIIGLPGEEITFRDGYVYVNGQRLEEDYLQDKTRCGRRDECDVVVPPDDVFVLGDHRSNSSDSRVFGPVPISSIIGKAWVSYWPIDDIGFVPHEDYSNVPEQSAAAVATPQ
jgi:signal peptidase I